MSRIMNKAGRLKFSIVTLVLINLLMSSGVSANGGASGKGGGHLIEAGFKAKALAVASDLAKMIEPARRKLTFDPNKLEAQLNAQGQFYTLCADAGLAAEMKKEGKMARVYAYAPRTVYLDCANYSFHAWQSFFDSKKPSNIIFFLHEALRVAGQADENDYGPSSSYLRAHRVNQSFEREFLKSLLYPEKGARCQIIADVGEKPSCAACDYSSWYFYFDLRIDGKRILPPSNSGLWTTVSMSQYGRWELALPYAIPRLIKEHLAGNMDAFLNPFFEVVKSDSACWKPVLDRFLKNEIDVQE